MFDPVTACQQDLTELAGEDRRGWSPAARADRVRDLARLAERTQAGPTSSTTAPPETTTSAGSASAN